MRQVESLCWVATEILYRVGQCDAVGVGALEILFVESSGDSATAEIRALIANAFFVGKTKDVMLKGSCLSLSSSMAAIAKITPSGPSYLPAFLTVSRCEPSNSVFSEEPPEGGTPYVPIKLPMAIDADFHAGLFHPTSRPGRWRGASLRSHTGGSNNRDLR